MYVSILQKITAGNISFLRKTLSTIGVIWQLDLEDVSLVINNMLTDDGNLARCDLGVGLEHR